MQEKKLRNLVVYKDNQFPRYLQIKPREAEAVMIPQYNHLQEVIGHKPGRLSKAGMIDLVTIPDQPVEVGDQFRTNISVIEITNIVDSRPAKGAFAVENVQWVRCEFALKQRTF